MASGADSIGDGGDGGQNLSGRFDPGQGTTTAGNAPLEPRDTRTTPGRGYDPVTGNALPVAGAGELAGLGYDPVTGTVAVDVEGPADSWGRPGGYKDSIPESMTPAARELGHVEHAARDPHGPAAVEKEEEKDK